MNTYSLIMTLRIRGMRKAILIILTLFSVQIAIGQTVIVVEGRVSDKNDAPIPGASVLVKNTKTQTLTDINGKFKIKLSVPAELEISMVGYIKYNTAVHKQEYLKVKLQEELINLDELVIVGYTSQKKASLTGSLSMVKSEDIRSSPVGNVSQSLQGTVPGLNVSTDSRPGTDAKIRIRGLGTINNNSVLWVIDGVPRTDGMNELNPDEIESVTVLKDASSTAIYGARGANGVILVTTKSGKKSKPVEFTLNSKIGTSYNVAEYDLLDVEEYGEMLWLQYKNANQKPSHPVYGSGEVPVVPKYLLPAGANTVDLSLYNPTNYQITEANQQGTNWYKEILRNALNIENSLLINGGSEKTVYAFSVGHLKEEGVVKHSSFERFTASSNITSTLNNWLTVGSKLRIANLYNRGLQQEGENGPFGAIPQLPAIMPVYDIKGTYAPLSRLLGFDPWLNPIGDMDRGSDFVYDKMAISGSVFTEVKLLEGLRFKSLFGLDNARENGKEPLEANPESYQARAQHQLTSLASTRNTWNFTNTLNYSTQLNKDHYISALIGTEAISSKSTSMSATRQGFTVTDVDYWVLNAGEGLQTNTGSASDWATYSFFGNLHYAFKQRYLFDVVFRRDGSSRFGKDNRYGSFPAAAAGWVLSDENFFNVDDKYISFLKLKLSWGKSGNDQIGNYNGFSTYRTNHSFSSYPMNGSNNGLISGFESLAFGNTKAKWETTTSYNFGIESIIFKNFSANLDIWKRRTTDMLYPKGIPAVMGMGEIPSVNIGDMENKGIDLNLAYTSNKSKDFHYTISLNFSTYKNEILRLSDKANEVILGTAYRGNVYTQAEVGRAFPEFFGYNVLGIFQTQDEVNAHATYGSYNKVGRFKFQDVNGDGKIDNKDRTYIGSPHPDFVTGLSFNLGYKNFDLSASIYASVGNDAVNLINRMVDFNYFQKNRSKKRLYESWGSPYLKDNTQATMPMAELDDAINMLPSSYFVEDASFLRLQSLQVGYSFSNTLLSQVGLKKVRVFASGNNLLTLTKYTGLDPQIQTSDSNYGVDNGVWPTPRRLFFGLNVNF